MESPSMRLNNTASVQSTPKQKVTDLDKGLILVLGVLVITLGFLGNTTVIYLFGYKKRKKRKRSELLFTLLAMTDLVTSSILPIILWYRYSFTMHTLKSYIGVCISSENLATINITFSQGLLILICIERYRRIVSPFTVRRNANLDVLISIMIFTVSVTVMLPCWIKAENYCSATYFYRRNRFQEISLSSVLIVYAALGTCRDLFALGIMAFLIFRMMTALGVSESKSLEVFGAGKAEKYRRARKMLIVVIVVFTICILPNSILYLSLMVLTSMNLRRPEEIEDLVRVSSYFKILVSINSVANPIIYSFMQPQFVSFRVKVKNFLLSLCCSNCCDTRRTLTVSNKDAIVLRNFHPVQEHIKSGGKEDAEGKIKS